MMRASTGKISLGWKAIWWQISQIWLNPLMSTSKRPLKKERQSKPQRDFGITALSRTFVSVSHLVKTT